jgi:tetratricopeptide (TPR) repeat protein
MNLGLYDMRLGNYQEARDAYIKSINLGGTYQVYESLANSFLVYGNPEQNISCIRNYALIKYPNSAKIWSDLAILEYKIGNTNDAIFAIEQAYKYDPNPQYKEIYDLILNGKLKNINIILK